MRNFFNQSLNCWNRSPTGFISRSNRPIKSSSAGSNISCSIHSSLSWRRTKTLAKCAKPKGSLSSHLVSVESSEFVLEICWRNSFDFSLRSTHIPSSHRNTSLRNSSRIFSTTSSRAKAIPFPNWPWSPGQWMFCSRSLPSNARWAWWWIRCFFFRLERNGSSFSIMSIFNKWPISWLRYAKVIQPSESLNDCFRWLRHFMMVGKKHHRVLWPTLWSERHLRHSWTLCWHWKVVSPQPIVDKKWYTWTLSHPIESLCLLVSLPRMARNLSCVLRLAQKPLVLHGHWNPYHLLRIDGGLRHWILWSRSPVHLSTSTGRRSSLRHPSRWRWMQCCERTSNLEFPLRSRNRPFELQVCNVLINLTYALIDNEAKLATGVRASFQRAFRWIVVL